MKIQNEQVRQVLTLLGSPEMVNQSHEMAIRTFINTYPYVQPAYYLLVKSTLYQDCNGEDKSLAATYSSNGEMMYLSIHQSNRLSNSTFKAFLEEVKSEWKANLFHWMGFEPNISPIFEPEEATAASIEVIVAQDEIPEIIDLSHEAIPQITDSEENFENRRNHQEWTEKTTDKGEIKPIILPFEVETFDHIDSSFAHPFVPPFAEVSNIEKTAGTSKIETSKITETESKAEKKENTTISKYDDEALPYSFQWWLQKTRSDYYENHQPFVLNKNTHLEPSPTPSQGFFLANQTKDNPLENQYKAYIFNLQTPFDAEEFLEESEKMEKNKTLRIIDRFIETSPQISAPMSNKLDNENKARVSTNENLELVTETLAKIYVEQMLYSKAIVVYQKLSLKIPEKSRYFANLISQLQEKIDKI